jgi:hypothetical protein
LDIKPQEDIIRHVLSTFALITEAPFEWRRQLILEYKLAFFLSGNGVNITASSHGFPKLAHPLLLQIVC